MTCLQCIHTRWNIYTNQIKVKNYTSWNIETKPMTLVAYTSRCRKLHLKLSTLPTCSDGWNWGVAHCTKVWGPCYFSPLSVRDSLVPLELQGGHGTGKTGNLVLTFSRQGKHREFCCNTGKIFETQGKYFWLYLSLQKACFSSHIFNFF